MKTKIKHFSLVGGEFETYWPDDVSNFCIGVDVTISPEGIEGGDIFSFTVCSPIWFSQNKSQQATFARHVIFMNEYNEVSFKKLIKDLVQQTSGESWDEIANQLSRYMFWEFEDYEEYSS